MCFKFLVLVILENLLFYDFKYRIYDKNIKKDWFNFLCKGGVSFVYVVELLYFLFFSVDMQDIVFKLSEFVIINVGVIDDFKKEIYFVCKDDVGMVFNLWLYYYCILDSGGVFKVIVYSFYVVFNKMGMDVSVCFKGFM